MPDMDAIIKQHNSTVMNRDESSSVRNCNCRKPNECPVDNKCQMSDVIYQATVVTDNDSKIYIGSCSTTFKKRYSNHKTSFTDVNLRTRTDLASYIWQLKEQNTTYKIDWKIITKAKSYKIGSRACNLCYTEKFFILGSDRNIILNKCDLMTKCLHKFGCKLKYVT